MPASEFTWREAGCEQAVNDAVPYGQSSSAGAPAPASRQNGPRTTTSYSSDIDSYEMTARVYAGAKSCVSRGVYKPTGQTVIVKAYLKSLLSANDFVKVARELSIFRQLSHKNIIVGHTAFQQGDALFLIQEWAENGDLCDVQRTYPLQCLPERTAARKVVHPLLLAIEYIHARGIMHRDIKPENILINKKGELKLCDFGLALNVAVDCPVSRVGTLPFMAPEIVVLPRRPIQTIEVLRSQRRAQYGLPVDVWSIGCVAYEALFGEALFRGEEAAIEKAILGASIEVPAVNARGATVSAEAAEFILTCLIRAPGKRPTAEMLLAHPWFEVPGNRDPQSASSAAAAASRSGAAAAAAASSGATAAPATVPHPATVAKRTVSCMPDVDVAMLLLPEEEESDSYTLMEEEGEEDEQQPPASTSAVRSAAVHPHPPAGPRPQRLAGVHAAAGPSSKTAETVLHQHHHGKEPGSSSDDDAVPPGMRPCVRSFSVPVGTPIPPPVGSPKAVRTHQQPQEGEPQLSDSPPASTTYASTTARRRSPPTPGPVPPSSPSRPPTSRRGVLSATSGSSGSGFSTLRSGGGGDSTPPQAPPVLIPAGAGSSYRSETLMRWAMASPEEDGSGASMGPPPPPPAGLLANAAGAALAGSGATSSHNSRGTGALPRQPSSPPPSHQLPRPGSSSRGGAQQGGRPSVLQLSCFAPPGVLDDHFSDAAGDGSLISSAGGDGSSCGNLHSSSSRGTAANLHGAPLSPPRTPRTSPTSSRATSLGGLLSGGGGGGSQSTFGGPSPPVSPKPPRSEGHGPTIATLRSWGFANNRKAGRSNSVGPTPAQLESLMRSAEDSSPRAPETPQRSPPPPRAARGPLVPGGGQGEANHRGSSSVTTTSSSVSSASTVAGASSSLPHNIHHNKSTSSVANAQSPPGGPRSGVPPARAGTLPLLRTRHNSVAGAGTTTGGASHHGAPESEEEEAATPTTAGAASYSPASSIRSARSRSPRRRAAPPSLSPWRNTSTWNHPPIAAAGGGGPEATTPDAAAADDDTLLSSSPLSGRNKSAAPPPAVRQATMQKSRFGKLGQAFNKFFSPGVPPPSPRLLSPPVAA